MICLHVFTIDFIFKCTSTLDLNGSKRYWTIFLLKLLLRYKRLLKNREHLSHFQNFSNLKKNNNLGLKLKETVNDIYCFNVHKCLSYRKI